MSNKIAAMSIFVLVFLVVFWALFLALSPTVSPNSLVVQPPPPPTAAMAVKRKPLPQILSSSPASHAPRSSSSGFFSSTVSPSPISHSPSPPEHHNDTSSRTGAGATTAPANQKPQFFIISFVDDAASAGYIYAAMTRLCYAHKYNYRAILFTEKEIAEFMPRKSAEHLELEKYNERYEQWKQNNSSGNNKSVATTSFAPAATTAMIRSSSSTNASSSLRHASGNNASSTPAISAPFENLTEIISNLHRLSHLNTWHSVHMSITRHWSKNFLMHRALTRLTRSEHDWVFWMDADVVVTNPALSLEAVVARVMSWRKASRSIAWHRRRRAVAAARQLEQERARHSSARMARALTESIHNASGRLGIDGGGAASAGNNTNNRTESSRHDDNVTTNRDSVLHSDHGGSTTTATTTHPATTIPTTSSAVANLSASQQQQLLEENMQYPATTPVVPDMIVSDLSGPINNGIYAMRNTPWSLQFLEDWRRDYRSMMLYEDNGPFMHAVLRVLFKSRGIEYKEQCHERVLLKQYHARLVKEHHDLVEAMRKNASYSFASKSSSSSNSSQSFHGNGFNSNGSSAPGSSSNNNNQTQHKALPVLGPLPRYCPISEFKRCYEHSLRNTIAENNPHEYVSRCPFSYAPEYDIAYRDINSTYRAWRGKNWDFGWLMRDDPHIGGDCRINSGLGDKFWAPTGMHSQYSLTVHTAGFRIKTVRDELLKSHSDSARNRFSPPCF